MSVIKNNKSPDLYIDNQPMILRKWEITQDYDHYTKLSHQIKIILSDGDTEVIFKPRAVETKEGSYHLYGLLESLFPNIAGEYYMEDWKAAYVDYQAGRQQLASQAIHRYTIDKNDNRFTTKEAKAFKAGYDARKVK